jgi:hypothetical protein
MAYQKRLNLSLGRNLTDLKHATFLSPVAKKSDLVNYTNWNNSESNPGRTGMNITKFKINKDSPDDEDLQINTDYHTYLFLNGNVVGYFVSNITPVEVDSVVRTISFSNVDYPHGLTGNVELVSEVPIEYSVIIRKDVLSDPDNIDHYGTLQSSSDSVTYYDFTLTATDSPDYPWLSETESYYMYLFVKNAHDFVKSFKYDISPTSSGVSPEFDLFTVDNMGNLDSLTVLFRPTQGNVDYYFTAFPEDYTITREEIYMNLAGNIDALSGNISVTLDTLFDGNGLIPDSNVVLAGLVVDRQTGAFGENTLQLVMDRPVIEDISAAPIRI